MMQKFKLNVDLKKIIHNRWKANSTRSSLVIYSLARRSYMIVHTYIYVVTSARLLTNCYIQRIYIQRNIGGALSTHSYEFVCTMQTDIIIWPVFHWFFFYYYLLQWLGMDRNRKESVKNKQKFKLQHFAPTHRRLFFGNTIWVPSIQPTYFA